MAWELLAWDKYRATGDREPADAVETDRLIDRGAACFGVLLSTLHGDREIGSLEESDEWLRASKSRWSSRSEMINKGSLLSGPKLRLTDADIAQLDRVHPDRSFSGSPADRDIGADDGAAIDQLERLGALRAEGVLTEEEFRAAKARVLGIAAPQTPE
jgi:hypothetical protein